MQPLLVTAIIYIVYHSYSIMFMRYQTCVNLVILDMGVFVIILRMNLLFPYHAILGCHANTLMIHMQGWIDMSGRLTTIFIQ